jgi:hypothetical protein
MDGGHEDASINLRKEFIRADNINALLAKYDVPAAFDLLVVDIDFNDFWVLKVREVLVRRPPWQKPPSLKWCSKMRRARCSDVGCCAHCVRWAGGQAILDAGRCRPRVIVVEVNSAIPPDQVRAGVGLPWQWCECAVSACCPPLSAARAGSVPCWYVCRWACVCGRAFACVRVHVRACACVRV